MFYKQKPQIFKINLITKSIILYLSYKGSTYTAAAMKQVYEQVVSKSNGWRQGTGPPICSGVLIDGKCYWIPLNYVSPSQMEETCRGSNGLGKPANLDNFRSYDLVQKLIQNTFGFPDNGEEEREGPWAGMNVLADGTVYFKHFFKIRK